jgi:hypothetical protein
VARWVTENRHLRAVFAVCWAAQRIQPTHPPGPPSGRQLGAASTAPTFTRPVYVVTDSLATARLASCRAVATGPQQTLFLTSAGDIFAAGGSPSEQSYRLVVRASGLHSTEALTRHAGGGQ